jgi:pilus assembly protein CpaB
MKFKKVFKNRTTLGIATIILALIICFGVTPLISKSMTSQVEVIRAKEDIKMGEEITPDKITKIKVGGYNLPGSVVRDNKEVIGKYALTDIYKDDYFLSSKVSDIGTMDDSYLYGKKDENMSISITIKSLASGLSGKIKSGDIVSIISSNEQGTMPTIVPELKYVKVLSISTKEGKDIEKVKDELPETITLSVNHIQAEKLVEHEQLGEIHIALAFRGEEKLANEYLEIQNEYFDPNEEVEEEESIDEEIEENKDAQLENTEVEEIQGKPEE